MRTLALLVLSVGLAQAAPLPRLRISENGRFFVKEDGSPFFYLGDTAWALFRCTREDVDLYLKDRAAKRFTVIQAIVPYWSGLDRPNAYGNPAFDKGDPTRPNEAYFQHVDFVVNKAESLGLYVAMVPIWAKGYVTREKSVLDKASAYGYGKFLGSRYRDKPVIWILGGDWVADGLEDLWRAMAAGITEGDGGTHLKTYHPTGVKSSSIWFHQDAWLDFNMVQTGHRILNRNYELIASDYARVPPKPVVDGESAYEGITDNLANYKPGVKLIQAEDVRRIAYCAVFAGAAGYTYGSQGIFGYESNSKSNSAWGPTMTFREVLDRPAGKQMQYLRDLIESRPMLARIPDQALIVEDPMSTTERIQACRASDGSYIFVYSSTGRSFRLYLREQPILDTLTGKVGRAYWYDPRQGTSTLIGEFPKTEPGDREPDIRWGDITREFKPPSSGRGNDWVLVLDDASKNYPPPGRSEGLR
jgi:hypothetical protein